MRSAVKCAFTEELFVTSVFQLARAPVALFGATELKSRGSGTRFCRTDDFFATKTF